MYCISERAAQVRNLLVSLVNGAISLTILLIAPLGLFAVIVNTVLVVLSTYGTLTVSDRVIGYLQKGERAELLTRSGALKRRDEDE